MDGHGARAGRPSRKGISSTFLVPLALISVKLEETNEQLAALANEPDAVSASMLRTINHHAEIFQDNARELRRTKVLANAVSQALYQLFIQASVKSALDHANLLHGVRNDIELISLSFLRVILIAFQGI